MKARNLMDLSGHLLGVFSFAKDVNVEHHKRIEYPGDAFNWIWTVIKYIFSFPVIFLTNANLFCAGHMTRL